MHCTDEPSNTNALYWLAEQHAANNQGDICESWAYLTMDEQLKIARDALEKGHNSWFMRHLLLDPNVMAELPSDNMFVEPFDANEARLVLLKHPSPALWGDFYLQIESQFKDYPDVWGNLYRDFLLHPLTLAMLTPPKSQSSGALPHEWEELQKQWWSSPNNEWKTGVEVFLGEVTIDAMKYGYPVMSQKCYEILKDFSPAYADMTLSPILMAANRLSEDPLPEMLTDEWISFVKRLGIRQQECRREIPCGLQRLIDQHETHKALAEVTQDKGKPKMGKLM